MTKAHIMVVEDERIVAADIQDRLRALGYGVTALVTTGEEAEQVATETRPDLVLMDIMLKGQMDGIEAAERITSNLNIPVVFLTAHADETTLQRAKITAPFGYILKPFDERELHTTVEIALYRHATESKLKKVERWLAAVLESIADAVVATDKWGLITFLNERACSLTGWIQDDAVGRPLADVFQLVDEVTQQALENPVSRVVTQGILIHWSEPTSLISKGGAATPIGYTAAPIRDDQGSITGIVWVFRDVSGPQAARGGQPAVREIPSPDVQVGVLSSLLPVCGSCKRVRDDASYWKEVEAYLQSSPNTQLGLCPECAKTVPVASAKLKSDPNRPQA